MHPFPAKNLRILSKIKEGKISKQKGARVMGVSRQTVYRWLDKVKDSVRNKPYFDSKYLQNIIKNVAVVHPDYGPERVSLFLKQNGISISQGAVWLILKRLSLQHFYQRQNFSTLYVYKNKSKSLDFSLRYSPEVRKRIIEDVINRGSKIVDVCKSYGISRKTFFKWNKRYNRALENQSNILEALSDINPSHNFFINEEYKRKEKSVLALVGQDPALSSENIARTLRFISNHGVQRILERLHLSTYQERLNYRNTIAEELKSPVVSIFDNVKSLFKSFIPNFAPVPPPGETLVQESVPQEHRALPVILKYFFVAFCFSITFNYILIIWVHTLGLSPNLFNQFGLIFSSFALVFGTFFFLYSLKYYLTMALVLSFSQQEGETLEGTGERKKKGVLDWILSVVSGESKASFKLESSKRNPAGLQANLDHINLTRYPYISVQIPFYNEKNVVERSIAASTNFDYRGEYEVILCDDSTDETTNIIQSYIKSLKHAIKVVENTEDGWILTTVEVREGVTLKHLHRTTRSGFKGGALKLALTLCDPKTEFVSIFDADFVPYPDSLDLFLKYFKLQNGMKENYTNSNVAAVQGYQWHVLNKSENWITRGVRSEYAGSYVIERSGTEIYSGLKQISGSVYMVRRDALESVGWGTSITEDFELTLKLYNAGYKVVYTPYIQAPAECVSTLKRLIRQRMRWSEGHSQNIKRMFFKLLLNPNLKLSEKFELLYLSPYYLQAFFFLFGTLSWLLAETVFQARLPFWTELWGWSLVFTNLFALPLMNATGLFLEESEEKDYMGLLSFLALSYILVPFQAYSAVRGFLEQTEGPWFRTPKTGRITDIFQRGMFSRFIQGILGGKEPAVSGQFSSVSSQYFALATANSRFDNFAVRRKGSRWIGRGMISVLLLISTVLMSLAPYVSQSKPGDFQGNVSSGVIKPKKSSMNNNFTLVKDVYAAGSNSISNNGQFEIKSGAIALSGDKTGFSADEKPLFTLKDNRNFLDLLIAKFKGNAEIKKADVKVQLISLKGEHLDGLAKVDSVGSNLSIIVQPDVSMKPGKYSLIVNYKDSGLIQDFTWGVLAINTDKSIYLPKETANISIGVLDEKGDMVCDAKLDLEIQNPSSENRKLSTYDGSIKVNPQCKNHGYSLSPDYQTSYQTSVTGIYQISLTANTKNGTYSINDSFEVKNTVAFDVTRMTATRINPSYRYPVIFTIKSYEDFNGYVTESVPSSFDITQLDENELSRYVGQTNNSGLIVNLDVKTEGGQKVIEWLVNFKKGEEYIIGYSYQSPSISPALYTLGPMRIGNFKESRQWQVAVDTVSTDSPTTSTGSWTNPTNAYATGGSYADITSGTPSGTETYGGYGFNLGAGDTPTQVRVRMDASSVGISGTPSYNPTANTNGTNPWTNPDHAYTSDNQYATEVYADTTSAKASPTGDGQTSGTIQLAKGRLPAGDGDTTGTWTASSGTKWAAVDEGDTLGIAGDSTTYASCTVAGYYLNTFTAFDVPASATIVDVKVFTYARRSGTTTDAARLKVGGNYYDSSAISLTTGYVWYVSTWTTNPKAGGAWTPAQVNGTDATNPLQQFGNNATVPATYVRVGAQYIVVDYTYSTFDYQNVHETTVDNTDSVTIFASSGSTYQLFTYPAFSIPTNAENIRLRITYVAADQANVAGTNNIRAAVRVNGTNYNTTDAGNNPPILATQYQYTFTTNPNTSAAWTVADINGSGSNPLQQFGVSSSDSNPTVKVDMVYAEVLYYLPNDQIYGTFGIPSQSADITKVEIGYEAFATATQTMDLYTSDDGGSNWNTLHNTGNLATSDPNAYTYIDVTSDASWTWTLLNNTNFKLKMVSNWVNGTPTWSVDALVVRVTYAAGDDDQIRMDVSWDGGTTWSSSKHTQTLTGSQVTYWVDVTSDTAWTPTKLDDSNFKVRVDAYTQGSWNGDVRLDWMPVEVTYTPGLSISGNIYQSGSESVTDNTAYTIALSVNNAAPTTVTAGSGTYSFPSVAVASGNTLAVYIQSNANDANTFTISDGSTNITNLHLYINKVAIGNNNSGTTTNANICNQSTYPGAGDKLISCSTNDITVNSNVEWHILSSKAYNTGSSATLTTQGTGSLHVDTSATSTLSSTATIASDILVYGGATLNINADTSVAGNITTSGTSALITTTSGTPTVTITGAGTIGGGTTPSITFYNLTTNGSSQTTTLNSPITVSQALAVGSSHVLAMGTNNVTVGSTSISGSGGITINGSTSQSTPGIFTILSNTSDAVFSGSGTLTVYDLTIGDGSHSVSIDDETNDVPISIGNDFLNQASATYKASSTGSFTIGNNFTNSGTFTANSGTVTMNAGDSGNTLSGTMTGTSSFNNLTFNNSGGSWSFSNDATTNNNFTITSATQVTAPSGTLTVKGNFTGGAVFTHNSGTVSLAGAAGSTQQISGTTTFYSLSATTTSSRSLQFAASTTFTIAAGANLTLTGTDCNNVLNIYSSSSGTPFTIVFNSGGTATVTYTIISDSTATNALTANSSVSGGGNTGWTINNGSCPASASSTSSNATAYSFQRKTWHDGKRYWESFYSGSDIQFWYSVNNGSTWIKNTAATISVSTNDFSVQADSSNAFIAYTNGNNIEARKASSYPGTSFSWGNATVVFTGSSAVPYEYPTITIDSNNKLWISTQNYGATSIFSNGFESGDFTNWTTNGTSGTGSLAEVIAGAAHTGSDGAHFTNPTASQNGYGRATKDFTFPAGNILYARYDLKINSISLNSSGVEFLGDLYDNAAPVFNYIVGIAYVGGTPNHYQLEVRARDGSFIGTNFSSDLSTGTWYTVKIKADYSGTNPVYTVFINGTQQATYTDSTTGTIYKPGTIRMETWENGWTATADSYIDNVGLFSGDPDAVNMNTIQSTNANNISAWQSSTVLNTSTNSNQYGVIVPRTSGSVYSVWIDGATIEGKNYNGSSWDSSPTTITSLGLSGLSNNISALADSSGNVHLTYVNSSGNIQYQEFTSSWQTAVALDSNAGNAYTSTSLNTLNNDIYAFWTRGNHIYYKKGSSPYTSGSWDTNATDWKSDTAITWVTSDYSADSVVFAQWTVGSGSPYTIGWALINVPERIWLFFGIAPLLPLILRRKKGRRAPFVLNLNYMRIILINFRFKLWQKLRQFWSINSS